jgi:hypothetical protein
LRLPTTVTDTGDLRAQGCGGRPTPAIMEP